LFVRPVSFFCLFVVLSFADTLAYDCVPLVRDTDVVFKGKVKTISSSGKTDITEGTVQRLPDKRVTFRVLDAYGVKLPSTVNILYYSLLPSDSMPAAIGEVRWVYANWNEYKTELTDSSCGATRSPEELGQ
jgi:hypothetical protein